MERKNDMKLSADAVICKGGHWFEGEIDGFDFKILKRITKSDDCLAPNNHVTAKQFLYQKGVKDDNNKILQTLLKSIKIYAYTDKSKIAQKVGKNGLFGSSLCTPLRLSTNRLTKWQIWRFWLLFSPVWGA